MANIFSRLGTALVVLGLLASAPAVDAQDVRTQRVSFAAGSSSATITGQIRGYGSVDYLLGASAGQRLRVDMTTSNPSSYFNIKARGSDGAIFIGSTSGNSASVTLPSSGDWVVQVYLMRNAARRNETASYTLNVRIDGAAAANPPAGGDFADGDAGGPDWWAVTGVGASDRLNVRAGPSTANAIVARVADGTVLRNGGCESSSGTRWCRVSAPDGSFSGWAAGRFLRESAAPGPGASSVQAGLPELCRAQVQARFDLPLSSLTAYPAQQAGRGFEIFVQSNVTTREFNCRFGPRGRLLGID